ncbi:MAG: MoxR family ATPase [Bacteriovoracaceae bacterium]|nr:MoxR family ATPase [Bacteriovoracaceae bacterium]
MKNDYVLSNSLAEAIRVAEITKRPLLIKGEPGTGKTLLAHHYATQKNIPLHEWSVKSTTVAKDGLYFYDAITRLNDSRFENDSQRNVNNINDYIRFEAMGRAFASEEQCALLIDEIDKADIEFPNDLLTELDKMEFTILETGEKVKAQKRPFVFITSNNEKELPDAFLRRCVFHYIEFPNWDMMQEIVKVHYPSIDTDLLKSSLDLFYRIRDEQLRKKPSTSEFIDWINVLIHEGARIDSSKIPFIGSLVKNEEDLEKFR